MLRAPARAQVADIADESAVHLPFWLLARTCPRCSQLTEPWTRAARSFGGPRRPTAVRRQATGAVNRGAGLRAQRGPPAPSARGSFAFQPGHPANGNPDASYVCPSSRPYFCLISAGRSALGVRSLQWASVHFRGGRRPRTGQVPKIWAPILATTAKNAKTVHRYKDRGPPILARVGKNGQKCGVRAIHARIRRPTHPIDGEGEGEGEGGVKLAGRNATISLALRPCRAGKRASGGKK